MKLKAYRNPSSKFSYTASEGEPAEATLWGHNGNLQIQFLTGGEERQAVWLIPINSSQFTELAKEMMKLNSAATIRAFGSALKDFKP